MTKKEFLNLDWNRFNDNAMYICAISDLDSAYDWFKGCKSIEEINTTANELAEEYPDLFE